MRSRSSGLILAGSLLIVAAWPATPLTAQDDAYADRIRIGGVHPFERVGNVVGTTPFPLSNMVVHRWDIESEPVARLLFRALYRYDSVLTPVPDLAAEPCATSPDGLSLTCRVVRATFSDGDALTAEDVAFTYDLARSEACPFGPFEACLNESLAAVDVLDDDTVRFTLHEVRPDFVTTVLPNVWIDSKDLVMGQHQAFREAAQKLGSTSLRTQAEELDAALGADAPDCDALGEGAATLATSAGLEPPDRQLWSIGPGRTFDACGWAGLLRDMLFIAADSLDAEGIESIAIAYPILPLNRHPVGTGPWRLDEALSEPGRRIVLTAAPTAERAPATQRIDFVAYPTRRDAAEGYRAGEIDWLYIPAEWGGGVEQGGADLYRLVAGYDDVMFVEYPDPSGVLELVINVRAGKILSDPDLRHALALCLDRRAIVTAASDGQGVATASLISPDVWAANPTLSVPERDVAAAKRLVESSGWTLEGDTYQKDGVPLAIDVWVRASALPRVKLADLMAYQAMDCGIRIDVRATDSPDFPYPGPVAWPHHPPGESEPFDTYLAYGFGSGDPDERLAWLETSAATSAQREYGNETGYSDPAFDAFMQQARQTYDTAERARAYRGAAAILARDLPVLPLWHRLERVALRPGLTTLDGPLDLGKPGWDWRADRLVLRRQDQ